MTGMEAVLCFDYSVAFALRLWESLENFSQLKREVRDLAVLMESLG
jgi:hypothetical protein